MKRKSCYGRAASTCDHQHGLSKFTQEAVEHQQGGSSSSAGPQAAKKRSWKRYLTFLSKFQSKMKCKKPDNIKATHGSRQKKDPSRGLLEECSSLAHVIRRTASGCIAAAVATSSGAAGEADLPYVQLDQVTNRVKREASGPVYFVT